MKRYITCTLFTINLWMVAHTEQMSLQRALDLKLVKALVKSLGSYHGFCMQMELKNLCSDPLLITVEAGRRLNSIDDKQQDIIITGQQIIALKKQESRSFPVEGYCCQASNAAPSKGAAYGINKMADSNLVKLARYLNENKTESDVAQQAVWAISDGFQASRVSSVNDTVLSGIKQFVCVLKGEPIPWYSLITKTYVYGSGGMITYPTRLKGKLNFDYDQTTYATLHILDDKGTEVCEIIEQWLYPGLGQIYNLNLPVQGLPKGRYTIELKTQQKQLAMREFEI